MSLQTETYANVFAQVQALVGNVFDSDETARIDSLLNIAARRAYRRSESWPRWIVVDEPRSVSRGIVRTAEDSIYIYGAGTDEVNGLYKRNGTANSQPRYSLYDSDGTTILWDYEWNGVNQWEILVGAGNTDLTENTSYYLGPSSSATPGSEDENDWGLDDGASPTPLSIDVADIDTMLQISSRKSDFGTLFHVTSPGFTVDSRGFAVQGKIPTDGVVYCTYKKKLDVTYGDGTGGTTSTIPMEWANYMALYAAYMYQASQRQNNPNAAYGLALREVENALLDELEAIDGQQISNAAGTRVSTGLISDTSLY